MAFVRISKTSGSKEDGSRNSRTARVLVTPDITKMPDRPHFLSIYLDDHTDIYYDHYWFLADEIHDWFVETGITYSIHYEFDWLVEVADEHEVMVKLALGE